MPLSRPARWILRVATPTEWRDSILGDLEEERARRLSQGQRAGAWLLVGFATIAGLLAGAGIYSLLAHVVARRRPEIGVRIALGARKEEVVRLIAARAVSPILVGVGVGLGGAWLASRLVAPFVFGVSATEPRLYGAAPYSSPAWRSSPRSCPPAARPVSIR